LSDQADEAGRQFARDAVGYGQRRKCPSQERLFELVATARERKRAAVGKCEGRKSCAEINPELVRQAKQLRRRRPKRGQRSLRDVAAELAKLGFVNQRGAEFSASSVASMLRIEEGLNSRNVAHSSP
jgi:hypothetical protein